MTLSTKIIGMIVACFFVVLLLLSSISIVSLWNSQGKNIQLFKEEFLEQGRELLDSSATLFFNQIEYNSERNDIITNNSANASDTNLTNMSFSKKELLDYIQKIDPDRKKTLIIDIQNKSYIYAPSNPQLKKIIPENIISKLISNHILNNKDSSDIDNFQEFLMDNSNTIVPGRIIFKVYDDDGLIIGYGQTFDSGKVRIEFIERQNNQALWRFIITVILLSIIIVSIVIVVMIILLKYFILTPLGNITLGIRELKDGKLGTQLSIARNDEIGELAVAFNQMTIELKKSGEKLSKYNADLELKVHERTQEIASRDKQLTEANETLKKVNMQLQAVDTQKDEFISLAAHELKTPLTSIRGFAQVLLEKDTWGDSDNKHYVELINKNTDELYTLVTDIVDSSRISLGKLALNIEDVDIYKIFDNIKDNLTIIIREKGLRPEFHIDDNLPKIRADEGRTLQILRNLISNSTKFTLSGFISLHIYRIKDFICFEVEDTGQGIPKENTTLLFSKFYQVDSSLGLAICKGLVDGMGGQIWFKSEVGKGSIFYFTLPIVNGGN